MPRQAAACLHNGGAALMSRPKLLLLDEPFLGVAAIIIRLSLTGFDRCC
jgi:ABC-type branched-subunit amino acid transport system ATPase component